jgi:hypothetical protein
MTDPDSLRRADIDTVLSMANMLACGDEHAQAGLAKYHEQWQEDTLNVECLRAHMRAMRDNGIISDDTFEDFAQLVDETLTKDYAKLAEELDFDSVSG